MNALNFGSVYIYIAELSPHHSIWSLTSLGTKSHCTRKRLPIYRYTCTKSFISRTCETRTKYVVVELLPGNSIGPSICSAPNRMAIAKGCVFFLYQNKH